MRRLRFQRLRRIRLFGGWGTGGPVRAYESPCVLGWVRAWLRESSFAAQADSLLSRTLLLPGWASDPILPKWPRHYWAETRYGVCPDAAALLRPWWLCYIENSYAFLFRFSPSLALSLSLSLSYASWRWASNSSGQRISCSCPAECEYPDERKRRKSRLACVSLEEIKLIFDLIKILKSSWILRSIKSLSPILNKNVFLLRHFF